MATYPTRRLLVPFDKLVPQLRETIRHSTELRKYMEAEIRSGRLPWGRINEAQESLKNAVLLEEKSMTSYQELRIGRIAALSIDYLIEETMIRLKELLR